MAPLPKKKLSKIRRGLRRASQVFSLPKLEKCPQCGFSKKSHFVCRNCGYYKDRQVLKPKVETKITRSTK